MPPLRDGRNCYTAFFEGITVTEGDIRTGDINVNSSR
jgi:hypothetical protein